MAKRRGRKRTAAAPAPAPKEPEQPKDDALYLVGRPFIVTTDPHCEGIVCGQVDDVRYLVKINNVIMIVAVEQMLTVDIGKPTWHFFETVDDLEDWIGNQSTAAPAMSEEERIAAT